MKYHLIVAYCSNRGIGFKNDLPWNIRSDLIKFSKLTKGSGNNAIVMGKNTWLSLPKKPLPNRDNLVLSTSLKIEDVPENVKIFQNIDDLNEYCREKYENVWIIGGTQIYKEFLDRKLIREIQATYIDKEFECDVFFPELNHVEWLLVMSENHISKISYDFNILNKTFVKI